MQKEKEDKETGYGEVIKSLIKDEKEARIVEALLKKPDVSKLIEEMINYKGENSHD